MLFFTKRSFFFLNKGTVDNFYYLTLTASDTVGHEKWREPIWGETVGCGCHLLLARRAVLGKACKTSLLLYEKIHLQILHNNRHKKANHSTYKHVACLIADVAYHPSYFWSSFQPIRRQLLDHCYTLKRPIWLHSVTRTKMIQWKTGKTNKNKKLF